MVSSANFISDSQRSAINICLTCQHHKYKSWICIINYISKNANGSEFAFTDKNNQYNKKPLTYLLALNVACTIQIIELKWNCNTRTKISSQRSYTKKQNLLCTTTSTVEHNRLHTWQLKVIISFPYNLQSILSSWGALGWKTLSDLTKSPKSMTPFRLTSNRSKICM